MSGSRPVVDYGIETEEDEATISIRDNIWDDEITVYGVDGVIESYELAGRFGPKVLDTLSGKGFMDEDPNADKYSLRDVLVQTVGKEAADEVVSTLEVEDSEIEEVKRNTVREDESQTYKVVESFYVPTTEGEEIEHNAPSNDGPMFDDIEPRENPLPDLDEQLEKEE